MSIPDPQPATDADADTDADTAAAAGNGRVVVLWCPDWPVAAAGQVAGVPLLTPTVVVAGNRVVASSATARVEGVRRGMRRREAQSRCPELLVFEQDVDRDARLFEPVVGAVEALAPGVEVVRPGMVAVPARGPVGYFGGEERAAERLLDQVAERTGVECQVGIADGLFTAVLAAHRGVLVPAGGSAEFLAPLSIAELDRPGELPGRDGRTERAELVDLLRRLGLRTLGAFAALSERDVSARFGGAAVFAHRLASGRVVGPLARRRPPPELMVTQVLDPPADRLDSVAFAARMAAQRLHTVLVGHGLACTRLAIHAETTAGEQRDRVWRCAEPLTLAGIVDRVRWQLEGWLTSHADRPSAGVSRLRLAPEAVAGGELLQSGLALDGHDPTEAIERAERAGRAFVRVQGLLGQENVHTAVLGGGRGPADQIRLVPWGDEREPRTDPALPWPGQLPGLAPTIVPHRPLPALVLDKHGQSVGVTGRLLLTSVPVTVAVNGGRPHPVAGWTAPWPLTEHWWNNTGGRRAIRLQVLLTDPDTTEPNRADSDATDPDATEPNQAELNWAEPRQAELSRADPDATEPSWAELSRAEPKWAKPSQAKSNRAELSQAELNRAESNRTKLGRAKLNRAELSQAESNRAELNRAEPNQPKPRRAESNWAELSQAESNQAELSRAKPRRAEPSWAELNRADPVPDVEYRADTPVMLFSITGGATGPSGLPGPDLHSVPDLVDRRENDAERFDFRWREAEVMRAGIGLLLLLESGRWVVEGIYD